MKLIVLLFCIGGIFANEFTKANNKFSATVYSEIVKSSNGNILVSPFSVETILALTHSGARDQTAHELQNALHLPNETALIQKEVTQLLPQLKDENYVLQIANKMYVKNGFQVKSGFQKTASEVFLAEAESIDFTASTAAKTMNDWVEKATQDKIHNLIDSELLDDHTRVVLINALYFKANWSHAFYLVYTEKEVFYKSPIEVVNVDTMHNRHSQRFLYAECPHLNAKFLELPFKGEEASMTFILPIERFALEKLESSINYALMPHNLTKQRVEVAIPKFKIESKINMKNILQKLGVKLIFKDFEADLSGIAGEKGDLVVSEVIQKSFIDVGEEGVEAAAATFSMVAVPMSGTPPNLKTFKADQPFIFYIKVKGVIVFVGRVTDPSV